LRKKNIIFAANQIGTHADTEVDRVDVFEVDQHDFFGADLSVQGGYLSLYTLLVPACTYMLAVCF
jgi:hypothetical protein